MATPKTTTKKSTKKKQITAQDVMTSYMDYCLEHETTPKSVFKFTKAVEITEHDFYKHYGSFDNLQQQIWVTFFKMTMDVAHKDENYEHFTNREKMLTFFYTFFELLTLNRSYVLFTLEQEQNMFDKMKQLKALRKEVKAFAQNLIANRNHKATNILSERSEGLYSEGAWVQLLFLLKFWINDSSPAFEKTDMAIEKSVNSIFELFDSSPLDAVLDFGKFLWKERMM